MTDQDVADIKQKLVDIETAQQENHDVLWKAVKIMDDRIATLTGHVTSLIALVQEQGTA